jgi:sugar-phosphatase
LNDSVGVIRCGAILFDLDGVLVDSGAAVERAWERWAVRHRLQLHDVLAEAHGRRTTDTIRAVAPWLDAEAESRGLEEAETADTDGVVALPGATSLLELLPPGRWAVATSGTRTLATTRLTHAGLPLPKVLVTAEDVEHGKPDPQPYVAAAEALGVDPSRCLVIEDAPAGIAAGTAAGAIVLALTTTFAASELQGARYLAPSLTAVRLHSSADAGGGFELEVTLNLLVNDAKERLTKWRGV